MARSSPPVTVTSTLWEFPTLANRVLDWTSARLVTVAVITVVPGVPPTSVTLVPVVTPPWKSATAGFELDQVYPRSSSAGPTQSAGPHPESGGAIPRENWSSLTDATAVWAGESE